ncbi:hypothetical protein ACR78J_10545 [Sphingobacterium spiritivorum]|uniref:Uncharacterized protein n=1 Tax=Sphingobacterium spiritivorum TaxID=258 RepID=A0A380CL99_SPHSI|nr:hypothetical protein [Sphingobacterium spiritivorum]SUJ21875.1 Uncharacterised protein [Sphingobacterium spiritivorum]
MQRYLIICLLFVLPFLAVAQQNTIENFTIKENLTQNGKLAIVALDTAEHANERINGTYAFSLNGLKQDLIFHNGVAVATNTIESSTFVFFKHKNQEHSLGKLYYIFKSDKGLNPVKISGLILLVVPCVILLIAYTFRRFLVTAVILALVYVFFNYSQGLSISNLLESIFMGIKSFF